MINAYAALERGAKLTPYQYDPGLLGEHEVEIECDIAVFVIAISALSTMTGGCLFTRSLLDMR